jgi:hypothetical protein
MSTQYRLVQSGKTASGGCSAGQGSSEPVAPRIYLFIFVFNKTNLISQMDQGDTILVDSLNAYRRVPLGKLIVAQLVKQFPASYGPSAITVLKRPPQKYALSQMNQVYAVPSMWFLSFGFSY